MNPTSSRTPAEQSNLLVSVRPNHRWSFPALATLLAVACALACAPAPAKAAPLYYSLVKSFAPSNGFQSPVGLAINQSTGEVYVADFTEYVADFSFRAVYAFRASGAPDPTHPIFTEANGEPYPFTFPYGVTVDNTAGPDRGDVYVADNRPGTVSQFDPSGTRTAEPAITAANVPAEGTVQSAGLSPVVNNGGFSPAGVAVASNGDIYVADQSNNVIDFFEADGTFVSQFGAGQLSVPALIAAGRSGALYVANGSGTVEFEPSGACANSCTPIDPAAGFGVATDKKGDVFTDEGSQIAEFNPTAQRLGTFGVGLSNASGIAVSESTENVYVADFYGASASIYEPSPLPPELPTVGEMSTADSTPTTATLQARITPGFSRTDYRFQYGTTTAYGSNTPISESIGSVNTDNLDTANVSSLVPATTYRYRAVAINFIGTTHGPDQTFTTPDLPRVNGAGATNVTQSTATLQAQINPALASTSYYFAYGTGTSYGLSTPESASIGADNALHSVSSALTGLAPGTDLPFRGNRYQPIWQQQRWRSNLHNRRCSRCSRCHWSPS